MTRPPPAAPESPAPAGFRNLTLELDHGCFHDLTWRLTLTTPDPDVSTLVQRLVAGGWNTETRLQTVVYVESPHGHVLVVIPATGRLQLRLHYTTPGEARARTAHAVAADIDRLASR
ncbi:MAG: hypothetical protein HY903_04515 [Deltaproteobacteria bacterium]|nr:hypothetical protein [Deltaproteobacteria bacterium]